MQTVCELRARFRAPVSRVRVPGAEVQVRAVTLSGGMRTDI